MGDSDLLDFAPVPVRNRRGGWTAERQRAFVAGLAGGLKPGRAAASVGQSRQGAYLLRGHRGGSGFAAAWDAAVAAARARKRTLREPGEYERGVEGVLHPVRFRGRVAAWDRRFSDSALRRLLGRADALLEKRGAQGQDYFGPGMPKLCQEPPPPDAPVRRLEPPFPEPLGPPAGPPSSPSSLPLPRPGSGRAGQGAGQGRGGG